MIEINGYKFEDRINWLKLFSYKGNFIEHSDDKVDKFFKSLGISRKIFQDKFNCSNGSTFPEYIVPTEEVVDYFNSLSNPQEPNYEIY